MWINHRKVKCSSYVTQEDTSWAPYPTSLSFPPSGLHSQRTLCTMHEQWPFANRFQRRLSFPQTLPALAHLVARTGIPRGHTRRVGVEYILLPTSILIKSNSNLAQHALLHTIASSALIFANLVYSTTTTMLRCSLRLKSAGSAEMLTFSHIAYR